ncbi:MAG: 5'/3'-nucleotidase SurE [Peptococcaceae bacterium]|nr:5'/3'-nucleotidase SurE [Peptococcaceae bacterium]
MRILLTNDDGFFAPGITALYDVLSADHQHEITIAAPEGQRSATGRSITIYKPLFVTNHDLKGSDTGLAVNGTPTDCVKLAIQGDILPYKPDLIISGINDGPNVGTDIFYSGTVAAAMEGVLLGIPSIAVSLASYEYRNYLPSAVFIKDLIDSHQDLVNSRDGLLNINIPGTDENCWQGIRFTKLGKSVYDNTFEGRKAPFGKEYYWISGTPVYDDEPDSDVKAIQEGFVSITPLHSDLTDYNKIERLRNTVISLR